MYKKVFEVINNNIKLNKYSGEQIMEDEKKINIDFSELLKDLDNKWVILSEDSTKVIASADNLEDIEDKLQKGILFKVPDSNSYLAPYIFR